MENSWNGSPARRWIEKIRNDEKRAYALRYWLALRDGEDINDPVIGSAAKCSYMAKQAVRIELHRFARDGGL